MIRADDVPAADQGSAHAIRFVLDGRVHVIDDVVPTKSVLAYLREDLRRTGTKEGCAEGDCGACTVVVAELATGRVRTKTVNACLQLVPFLDGKVLYTVESLRATDGALHPVQQAMVDCHGSQCGFCTPGFVMSLFGLYVEAIEDAGGAHVKTPSGRDTRTALAGNLCRCTGYRPILDAAKVMFEQPIVAFDREAVRAELDQVRRTGSLDYVVDGMHFSAPRSLSELHALRTQFPAATIVAGNTDVGLWINKQLRDMPHLIGTSEVLELQRIDELDDALRIGAAVSLEDAYRALAAHYPELTEMWERFASPPIRNAGTLGGNVANGSPIGDSMPGLIALQSRVVLSSVRGARTIALEDFYIGYQKKAMSNDEIVEAIEVPLPTRAMRFRTYKVSKRYDSDISAVCAAFALTLDVDTVVDCRIAFGGMAATPKRASTAEAALRGNHWSETTAAAASTALATDFQPLSDLRASDAYRIRVAQNLLRRFYLETRLDSPLGSSAVTVFAPA